MAVEAVESIPDRAPLRTLRDYRGSAREARQIPGDVAAYVREHRLTELDPAHTTRRLVATFAIYTGVATVGFWADSLPLWCAAWIVMALVMIGAGAVMHESVHRLLYRTRWL